MVIPKRFGVAVLFLLVSGCATPGDAPTAVSPLQQIQQLPVNSSNARQCPRGTTQVCDRRKSIGCQCRGLQHLRALIRG